MPLAMTRRLRIRQRSRDAKKLLETDEPRPKPAGLSPKELQAKTLHKATRETNRYEPSIADSLSRAKPQKSRKPETRLWRDRFSLFLTSLPKHQPNARLPSQ